MENQKSAGRQRVAQGGEASPGIKDAQKSESPERATERPGRVMSPLTGLNKEGGEQHLPSSNELGYPMPP